MDSFDVTVERERLGLAPDCANCFGLCCVAHSFRASAFFAFDKPIGKPCPNLLEDFGCRIHQTLRPEGFSACTAYTCYGAGQKVAQQSFGGIDWRQAPETAQSMFQTLPIMRQLHELLWFVTEALDRCSAGADHDELVSLLDETERLTSVPAGEMSWGDVDHHCRAGEDLLGRVSASIRAAASPPERGWPATGSPSGDLRRADLRGADLRGADLRGAALVGADLSGADLRWADLMGADLGGATLAGADLRWADLMGADLGGATLAGADFSAAIFVHQSQLELARGDSHTCLSPPLRAPAHWPGADAASACINADG